MRGRCEVLSVIHFMNLHDLLYEFNGNGHQQIVRVAQQQRTETRASKEGLPLKTITLQVFVRSIYQGVILSYTALQEEIDASFFADQQKAKLQYDKAWDNMQRVRREICVAIREAGHEPRPGVIDLFDAKPIAGEPWPLSERPSEPLSE
jgi:hypothetical protein